MSDLFDRKEQRSFGKSFVKKSISGQGTIEYLIIVAVVIVIALVVVSLLVGLLESGSDLDETVSQLSLRSSEVSVVSTGVNVDGNYLVRIANLKGEAIVVSNVSVGSNSQNFSEELGGGRASNFVVSSGDVCSSGKNVVRDLVVTYYTEDGLMKKESFDSQAYFECIQYTVDMLANRCPEWWHSGQLTCWDIDGAVVSCSGTGQDADNDGYDRSNCLSDNGDGTVSDSCTDLMWEQGMSLNVGSWELALDYCNNLVLAGHSDWKLPNRKVVGDMYDYNNGGFYDVFSGTDYMWSSTTVPSSASRAFYLHSNFGGISYNYSKSNGYFSARCVRSE